MTAVVKSHKGLKGTKDTTLTSLEAASRSSRLDVFCKKGVLRNFAKIQRKTPVPESLF